MGCEWDVDVDVGVVHVDVDVVVDVRWDRMWVGRGAEQGGVGSGVVVL